MKSKYSARGFTLIELMIVVAIIGVLASVAYPSYKEYVARSRRAEARAVLVAAQQWMERFYTENFRYDKNSAGVAVTDATQFPSRFSVSPVPGQGSPMYDIAVVVTNNVRDVYSVTATRKAGAAMASDRCGNFSIDHLGRKDLTNYSGFATKAAALEACWK
nr:type IV pilin protein [uncultured Acidovorax sp.]